MSNKESGLMYIGLKLRRGADGADVFRNYLKTWF